MGGWPLGLAEGVDAARWCWIPWPPMVCRLFPSARRGPGGGVSCAWVVRRAPPRCPPAPGGWGGPTGPSPRPSWVPPVWCLLAPGGGFWEVSGLRVRGGRHCGSATLRVREQQQPRSTIAGAVRHRRACLGQGPRLRGGVSPRVPRCASGRGVFALARKAMACCAVGLARCSGSYEPEQCGGAGGGGGGWQGGLACPAP